MQEGCNISFYLYANCLITFFINQVRIIRNKRMCMALKFRNVRGTYRNYTKIAMTKDHIIEMGQHHRGKVIATTGNDKPQLTTGWQNELKELTAKT